MSLDYSLYIILLAAGIIVSVLFSVLLIRNRNIDTLSYELLVITGCILWIIAEIHIVLNPSFYPKSIWNILKYSTVTIIPVSYLLTIINKTNYRSWITLKRTIILFTIPVLTIFFIATNNFHYLFWRNLALQETSRVNLLVCEAGILFPVWVIFLYIIMFLTYFFILRIMIKKMGFLNLNTLRVALVLLIPFATHLLYIMRVKPFDVFDITSVALTASILLIIFRFTRWGIFDFLPIAKDIIIDDIKDNIVVIDNKNCILYLNKSAIDLFKLKNKNNRGKNINRMLPAYSKYFDNIDYSDSRINKNIIIFKNKIKRYFKMTVYNINCSISKTPCRIIILYDITEQKRINKSLNHRIKFENLITKLSTNFIKILSSEIDNEIRNTLKKVGEFTGADRSYIYIFNDRKSRAFRTYEWCGKNTVPKPGVIEIKIFKKYSLWWMEKINNFDSVNIQDTSEVKLKIKEEKEIIKPSGVKSILILPLIHNSNIKGFLGFESIKNIKRWTNNDITLLKLLAEILASVLEHEKTEEEIKILSLRDKLTGLYSRSYFEEELKRLDTKRQLPLSFIIGDVNGLKLINDAFGPKEGDRLLIKMAGTIKKCCRKEDIISRWGGDEFSILLPKTSDKDSEEILNRIRKTCAGTKNKKVPVSISLGTATKKTYKTSIVPVIKEAEDSMYRRKLLERNSISSSIISSLERTLREKSYETEEHALRMKDLAIRLGRSINLKENKLTELSLLSTLHDIGKIAITDEILLKKGKLNDEEWKIIKKHPEIGYNICKSSPQLISVAEAVLCHHEWWNGTGYPKGLKEKEIPLNSRIISIVDAYDVMTHDRSYKKAISRDDAIAELKRCVGTQFDPELVEMFINVL